MDILAANEIKKHDVSILEKHLYGRMHVLAEMEYQALLLKKSTVSGLFVMLEKPPTGICTRQTLDVQLKKERNTWE